MRCPPTNHAGFCRPGARKARPVTNATPPFVSELRDELVAAAQRKIDKRRTRHRRTVNGVAAVLVFVAIFSVFRISEKPSEAGVLSVTRENHLINVDLKSTSATPEQIADELQHAGIDATVTEVPVSPSGVGRFVYVEQQGGPAQPSSTYFQHFTLSDQKHQRVELRLGRTAQQNETYIKRVNAYDANEPLHCTDTMGRQVKDVFDKLRSLNVTIRWFNQTGPEITEIGTPPFPTYFINSAISDKPNSLLVYVAPEPMVLFGSTTDCP